MDKKKRTVIVVEAVALALIVGSQAAYAAPKGYIDPSTGGMLFQVLAVIVTMASGLVFLFSNKIKMLFNRGKATDPAADESNVLLTQMDDVTTNEDEDEDLKKVSPVTK